MPGVFDRVVIGKALHQRDLWLSEFLAIPIETRVKWILAEEIRFFLGTVEVPRSRALAWLRARAPMPATEFAPFKRL
jgi:hypothetical protein